MGYTRQLARFAAGLRYADLPAAVIETAKAFTLHALGVQLAGSTLPWSKSSYRTVRAQGGVPESTVVNYGLKTSAMNAAFANGAFGHSFEMDDNHAASSIKGGCVLVPAALAVGERQLSSGRDVILATVIGYEIMVRIALSVTPSLLRRGHQPTAACGPFGAGAATGRLLRFDEELMLHTLGIAAAQASGLTEAPASGRGELKRIYGGLAASNGIRAALLAREGLTGPESILEGEQGFCHAFGDTGNLAALTAGLGSEWQMLKVHYKIYAQDGYIQPMTEALDVLVKKHGFGADDIAEIRAGCSQFAHDDVVGAIREPGDLASAQYSANFSLALFMIKGGAGFTDYTEDSLHDPRILALSRKIHVYVDDEVDQAFRKSRPRGARVTVRLISGATHSHYVANLREMTTGDVEEKFRRLAAVVMAAPDCDRFVDIIRNLDAVRTVTGLVPLGREPA